MMKKLLSILLLAAGMTGFAANGMSERKPLTDYLVVTNKYFRCTFFPGHMFPVWFETPQGKKFPPVVRFLDRVVCGKTPYWLYADLWAEQKILADTPEVFSIRCSGVYCHVHGDRTAPGNVRAEYTWTIRRDSPVMRVDAVIERDTNDEMQLNFLQPAWSMLENFDAICRSGQPVTLQPGHGFRKGKSATFVKDGLAVTTTLKGFPITVQARFRSDDGFSSHTAYAGKTNAKRIELTGFLRFHRWKPVSDAK
jgi:predicted CxxxxCH...CXXCH cytochrome family protein